MTTEQRETRNKSSGSFLPLRSLHCTSDDGAEDAQGGGVVFASDAILAPIFAIDLKLCLRKVLVLESVTLEFLLRCFA